MTAEPDRPAPECASRCAPSPTAGAALAAVHSSSALPELYGHPIGSSKACALEGLDGNAVCTLSDVLQDARAPYEQGLADQREQEADQERRRRALRDDPDAMRKLFAIYAYPLGTYVQALGPTGEREAELLRAPRQASPRRMSVGRCAPLRSTSAKRPPNRISTNRRCVASWCARRWCAWPSSTAPPRRRRSGTQHG